jgi:hypothetical protein
MLVLAKLPLERLIDGLVDFLERDAMYQAKRKTSKTLESKKLRGDIAQQEAAMCLLLYSYVVHSYGSYELAAFKTAAQVQALRSIWGGMCSLAA